MSNVWGITDVGLVRRENQDAYAVREQTASGHTICVVCDGMGGAAGGKLASRIAVETFVEDLEKRLQPDMTPDELKEVTARAVDQANQAIRETAGQSERYQNMGTTLVSAVTCAQGVVVANVGDSRAYHITADRIIRVTRDHSLVERMVEEGNITPEEARHHPKRNLITRALGPDVDAQCDCYLCELKAGDFLLLCTDGLVNTVTDMEMFQEIRRGEPEDCLKRLLRIALCQGAPDNVTAVLLRKV